MQTICVVGRRNTPVVGGRNAPQAHNLLWRQPALRPHLPRQLLPLCMHLGQRSPPVADAELTYLTKHPYKRQKKALQPTAAPAPTAAPVPASLVGVDGAAARTPAEKKPPTVLLPVPTAASVPFLLDKLIHPCSILIKIVGMTVSCQGCLCKEHEICNRVLKEDVVVCFANCS